MINPPNKRGAYVDGHQRTHKAEPLAQWETRARGFKDQGRKQDLAVHYYKIASLLQTVVKTAFVAKTMTSLSEYDDILDIRELFENSEIL